MYSDSQLVQACLQGQAWAWESIVDRYKRLVYSIALKAGLTEQDAADVFQTVFSRLLEHLDTLREPENLAAWITTTTKRASWRLSKKRRREPTAQVLTETPGVFLKDEADQEQWIDQALVRDALRHLGERCKRLLWLLYYDPEEPSYACISEKMEMPLGSVGPTRARCLKKMRTMLESMGMSVT
jgi:RNA polymerase sigma factor (sigma-70 family)